MNIDKHRRAIGAFAKRRDVQLVLRKLKNTDFPIKQVSIIAKDKKEENNIAGVELKEDIGNKANQGTVAAAFTIGTTGRLTALLVGLGLLVISGVGGSIMLAGAEATAIAIALAGDAISTATGDITGALVRLGIPDEKAKTYSDQVEKGYDLLIVNGDNGEIATAEMIFCKHGVENWGTYDVPTIASTLLNRRYQYAAGLFFLCQDLENALNDLRENDFPMQKVNLVAKSDTHLRDIAGVPIVAFQYDFAAFDIPDDIAKHYNYRVILGDYLVLLGGTAIQLAAAQSILEQHQIQNYATFHPYVATSTTISNNYRVISRGA